MSARRKFVCVGLATAGLWLCAAMLAETPQEAARKAMEASVARQRQAVAAMQIPIEKQRAAIAAARPEASGRIAPSAPSPEPFFTLSWPPLSAACDPLPEIELNPLIQQAAKQEGLMQLMPATIQELGVHDPFDPAESLLSGARLLKDLLARFDGNTALALGAYNAGPARVEESGGVPQIPETIRYVQQILSRLPIP
jgi:hypothetical protein